MIIQEEKQVETSPDFKPLAGSGPDKITPEAVAEINGVKFVKLDAVMGLLVNAVKELKNEVTYLKSELLPDLN